MIFDYREKVVVVSGATRGIGKEISFSFAKSGAIVVGLGTNEDLLAQLQSELRKFNIKSSALKCNVSKDADVKTTVDQIVNSLSQINILVNNAGITKDNLLLRMSEEEWDSVIAVNLKGTFLLTKHCSKYMIKQKSGRIINISSVTGIKGNKGQANYSATKSGVLGFTMSAAKELASRNITVNAVLPGFIETDMTSKLPKDELVKHIPAEKLGSPSDIANAVMYLASDQAGYVTGSNIIVDGGLSLNI